MFTCCCPLDPDDLTALEVILDDPEQSALFHALLADEFAHALEHAAQNTARDERVRICEYSLNGILSS